MNDDKPEFVSVRWICEKYGWHKATVHRLLRSGTIVGKKMGRKTMILLASVEAYVANLPDR